MTTDTNYRPTSAPPLRPQMVLTAKKAAVLFTIAGISLLVIAYNISPITQGLGSLVGGAFDWESSSLQANAEATVKQMLFDPGSAQFDKPVVIKSDRLVCGFVNAKNRFGGYVGRELYVYSYGYAALITNVSARDNYKDLISKCGFVARS